MTHQVELDQIAEGLREQYPGTDAYGIAQYQGLWLRPQLGAAPELRGRVIVFDVTQDDATKLAQVLRCTALFVLRRLHMLERLASRSDVASSETLEEAS